MRQGTLLMGIAGLANSETPPCILADHGLCAADFHAYAADFFGYLDLFVTGC